MSALIIHHRNSVLCYTSDSDGARSVTLPLNILRDMDVVDEDAYSQTITKAFGKQGQQRVPAILVLADDVSFVTKFDPAKADEQKKQIVNNIPFAHVEIAMVTVNKEQYMLATNADLYEAAVRALDSVGFTIQMVIPWSAIAAAGLSVSGEIDRVTVKRITDAVSALKSSAFPIEPPQEKTEVKPQPGKEKVTRPPLSKGWIIFGALALLYAVGMIIYMLRK